MADEVSYKERSTELFKLRDWTCHVFRKDAQVKSNIWNSIFFQNNQEITFHA